MTRFRRFVVASGLANLADGIATLAWVWIASLLTRDAALIALVPVALRLPWVLCAIPAGIVADRVDRRRLVVAMDGLRAVAFAAAALALWLAAPDTMPPQRGVAQPGLFALLCLAALTVGVAEVFRDNAAQTLLPAIVPPSGLERANGRLWTVEAVTNQMLGPALGAFLLGTLIAAPFAVNALAYAVSGLLMAHLAGRFRPHRAAGQGWRADLAEGFRFLRGQPLLLLLALVTGLWNLCESMVFFTLVLHAQENLGLSAQQYGFVLAAMAVGGMIGGLTGDRVVARLGPARTAGLTLLTSAAATLAMPMMPGGWSLALCFLMLETGAMTWNIVSVSTRQRLIDDALRGRVNSLYRLLAWGMIPLGTLAAGWIIRVAEPSLGRSGAVSLPLWVAAGALVVLAVVAQRPLARGLSAIAARQV